MGGSERHLVDLLAGQLRHGLDARMFVLADGDSYRFQSALADAGVPTRTIPAGATLSPSVLARLTGEVRRFHPDLVHTHLIHADVHGQAVARLLGVRSVSTIHGPQPFYRHQPVKAAAALAGRLARRTIVVSRYLRDVVVDWGIVAPDRVRVVPYGVDAERWTLSPDDRRAARAELGLAEHDVAIGIASRLIEGKGHDLLIEAVALARKDEPSFVLVIAGDGDCRPQVEALAVRRLAGAVKFVGYLPDVARFLHAADVVAVPTQPALGEGFGLVALEAMACGRPVVATDTSSLPEVVAHRESGLVVPAGDAYALAGALLELGDAGLRRQMGEAGRARAATRFSLDAMVRSTAEVYEEALTPTPRRSITRGTRRRA